MGLNWSTTDVPLLGGNCLLPNPVREGGIVGKVAGVGGIMAEGGGGAGR